MKKSKLVFPTALALMAISVVSATASTPSPGIDEITSHFVEQDILWVKPTLTSGEIATNEAMVNYLKAIDFQGKTIQAESHDLGTFSSTRIDGISSEVSATVTYHLTLREPVTGKIENVDETDIHILKFGLVENSWTVLSDSIVPMSSETSTTQLPTSDVPSSGNFEPVPHSSVKIQPRMTPPGGGSAQPMGALNYTSMVNYALLWTNSAHASLMNSNYPTWSNNCTNFVSQVLDAGGWTPRNGTLTSISRDTNIWSYNMVNPIYGASYSWNNADYLYTFVRNVAKLSVYSSTSSATLGDIIFVDWDPNNIPDGSMDHAMVVTQVESNGTVHISQKTANEYNISIGSFILKANSQGHYQIKWYVVRT